SPNPGRRCWRRRTCSHSRSCSCSSKEGTTQEMSAPVMDGPRASASSGYYEFERPEVIALIPPGAQSVLEFGCASGACGARIKRERGAYVVGVELLPEPAEVAR